MAPNPPRPQDTQLPHYTREEVRTHKTPKDCWIILHGEVYDVTKWLARHPGGGRLLEHYGGQDATVCAARS